MDTLFRLVTHQYSADQYSFNSSTTASVTSSRNPYEEQDQECFGFYMDHNDEDFSSSSSYPYHHYQQPNLSNTPTPTTTTTTTTGGSGGGATATHHHTYPSQSGDQHTLAPVTLEFASALSGQNSNWASDILMEAAKAIAEKNSARLQQLMWMLNEMSSPYGDVDQKLASYFMQALFSRMTDSGERTYGNLISASEKNCSFDSTRKMVLKFQEVSPWTMFGHVACNGSIMEALEGESKIHIIDISNTYCTQWPTLLEAIATRADETPHLRLTTVVVTGKHGGASSSDGAVQRVMKEIGSRMEKFARLMGVPFRFNIKHLAGDLSELNFAELEIKEDEALAINCVGTLHSVKGSGDNRDFLVSTFRKLQPRILTIVEEEADLDVGIDGFEFVRGFQECLRWFRVYFEALEESFPRTSNERLMLEQVAGRAVVDLVACPPAMSVERRETAARWCHRLHAAGFSPASFNEEVCDDMRSLLRRYKEGWSMTRCDSAGIFLSWKEMPVVWASAWKP